MQDEVRMGYKTAPNIEILDEYQSESKKHLARFGRENQPFKQ